MFFFFLINNFGICSTNNTLIIALRRMTLVLGVLPSKTTSFPAVYSSSFRSMSESSSAAAKSLWQLDKHLSVYALLFPPTTATATLPPHSQPRRAKKKKKNCIDTQTRGGGGGLEGDIRSAFPRGRRQSAGRHQVQTHQPCSFMLLCCDSQPLTFRSKEEAKYKELCEPPLL